MGRIALIREKETSNSPREGVNVVISRKGGKK